MCPCLSGLFHSATCPLRITSVVAGVRIPFMLHLNHTPCVDFPHFLYPAFHMWGFGKEEVKSESER